MTKPIVSIVILSYNTQNLLRNCLASLSKLTKEVSFEVIVPDNGSSDGSVDMVEREFPWVKKIIKIGKNIGFGPGNNTARNYCSGKYVLFLNSDTLVPQNTLKEIVRFMAKNPEVGAVTCKVVLPSGELDKDTRRSFITPWIGLIHLILKLDRIFPTSKLFAKYWYGYMPASQTHEVDAIQGAFFLSTKTILDKVGWFDESYFLDGEDIDLCWKIKESGFKIVYYPKVHITHIKGASKGKTASPTQKEKTLQEKLKYRMAGVNSMEIFYRKHLWIKYPLLVNLLVVIGIKIIKVLRFLRTVILG
jgi:GT2 family glycosyltransferase